MLLTGRIDYEHLPDDELVSLCLENSREAWNEFFRRFIPLIKRTIKSVLTSMGHARMSRDIDIIADVHESVVTALYGRGILEQCDSPACIGIWLKKVVRNKTIDWLRSRGRLKNLPEKSAGESTISLHTPLDGAGSLAVIDTLEDMTADIGIEKYIVELETMLSRMNGLDNVKAFWAIRLSIIAYDPLSEKEIRNLSRFNNLPLGVVRENLALMEAHVEKKIRRKMRAEAKAVALWYEIRRMTFLYAETGSSSPESLDRIEQKRKSRKRYLRDSKAICRPSNEQIACLVGLADNQVHQITNILKRARQKMRG